jgi:hypothetical protein
MVTFYGDERDAYGMPIPFNRYLVVAAPWPSEQSVGSAIATVMEFAGRMDSETGRNFHVAKGGEDAACGDAVDALRQCNCNQGLHELMQEA